MIQNHLTNFESQLRKGTLEFIILLVISNGPVYASDILKELQKHELLVVEGTLYPLLNRLKTEEILTYKWEESKSGPPRKYYFLTEEGKEVLTNLQKKWLSLNSSINLLIKSINKK
jgi:PadR family transcriptional regulator, regulatory protein PadR